MLIKRMIMMKRKTFTLAYIYYLLLTTSSSSHMRSSIPARLLLPSLQKHHPKGIRIRAKVPLNTMSAEEEKPLFSDATGEALNASALKLVREATSLDTNVSADDDDMNDDPESMRWIETVKMTPGKHKYVLMKVYNEENGEKKLLVRSYAKCSYHAENFQEAMRELRKDERIMNIKAYVIGGGRIEYDVKRKSVNVYGYSMTFGRTPGCNKKTMEIIRKRFAEDGGFDGGGPLAECKWSDEGY